MDDRTRQRAFAAREVMRCLSQQDFRTWLPRREDGPMVVALTDDTVADTFTRIRRDGRLCGHIVVVDDRGINLISSCPAGPGVPVLDDDDDLPIHRASEMGMLLALLRRCRKPVRVSFCSDVELELIDGTDDPTPVSL